MARKKSKILHHDQGIDIVVSHGRTALMYAATKGQEDNIRKLLDSCADTGVQGSCGDTALLFAVVKNNTIVVQMLIAAGDKIDIQNKYAYTALMKASSFGLLDIVRLLT